jgi:hypothetical protein
MKPSRFASLAVVTLCAIVCPVAAIAGNTVPGEKIDSGLGELPHYSKWAMSGAHRATAPVALSVPGESLDDGVAALPHYSHWKDRTGKDPLGQTPTLLSVATR